MDNEAEEEPSSLKKLKEITTVFFMFLSFFIVFIFAGILFSNCSVRDKIRISEYSVYEEATSCTIGMHFGREQHFIYMDMSRCLKEHIKAIEKMRRKDYSHIKNYMLLRSNHYE